MSWIIAVLGLAAAGAGGAAVAMGWPLVPLEKGWTMVIAGATLGSGGLVCLALAALVGETRRTRRTIERMLDAADVAKPVAAKEQPAAVASPAAAPAARLEAPQLHYDEGQARPRKADAVPGPVRPRAAAEPPAPAMPRMEQIETPPADSAAEDDGPPSGETLLPARSFTVGDTTFVVFEDGSIEARTREGTKRFASMDEVRAYLEASVT
jgi:hypothetical protein